MANTYTQLYIQFVFAVQGREQLIPKAHKAITFNLKLVETLQYLPYETYKNNILIAHIGFSGRSRYCSNR